MGAVFDGPWYLGWGLLPEGRDLQDAVQVVAEAVGIPAHRAFVEVQAKDGDLVIIHRDRLRYPLKSRAEARERYANFILPTLSDPYEIWLTDYDDGVRKHYVGAFTRHRNVLVVVRPGSGGNLLWNFMQADDRRMNGHRLGTLLYSK